MCLAIPGQIVSMSGDSFQRMARIDFGGVTKEASLALLPDVQLGDYVIVHAGIAIAQLDQAAAERTLDEIDRLDLSGASAETGQ